MTWLRAGLALCATAVPELGVGQSTLLTALEGSPPAPIIAPTGAALTYGLSGVWTDPTVDPRVTGVFFGMQHASYASVQVFHAAFAFRLGPRWSLSYATSRLGDLFDSSLTSQDPSLASLRAQAAWGRLDATVTLDRVTTSIGLSVVSDDDVGVVQGSTIAHAHLRIAPLGTNGVTIGVHGSRPVGGSVPTRSEGRRSVDLTLRRTLGESAISVTVGASGGTLWQYSETRAAYGIAAQLSLLAQLDVGVGIGRYDMAYGASRYEWYRSASGSIRIGNLSLGTRYASTRIGLGSGFAVSLGYERGSRGTAYRAPRTKLQSLSR